MVVRPRLSEGSGYVLNGGGICMELLTPSEWSPATSVNALVMSIRAMLLVGNARLREVKPGAREHDYMLSEAQRDFAHIVKARALYKTVPSWPPAPATFRVSRWLTLK